MNSSRSEFPRTRFGGNTRWHCIIPNRLNPSAKPSRIHQLVVVAVVAAWGLAIPMAAAFFERIMEELEQREEGLYYQSAYIPY
jgi:hypothetical protein